MTLLHSATALLSALTALVTMAFLVLERARPGRELPHATGWYGRALLVNLAQLLITLGTVHVWPKLFGARSSLHLSGVLPVLQGLYAWFLGTFAFYWWHRLRHAAGRWLFFRQVHHSASRIEILTSFYKHPLSHQKYNVPVLSPGAQ